jgi:predicted O-linked N-acetylglucosamine transferase (SPINDLY family)
MRLAVSIAAMTSPRHPHLFGRAAEPGAALAAQGLALHQAGRLAEAERAYRRALQAQPDQFDALHGLGVIGLQMGHPQAALDLLQRALAQRPEDPEAASHAGMALQALGRHAEALQCFGRALDRRPGFPEALNNRGNSLLELQQPQAAREDFEQALAARPDFLEARFNLGNALQQLGQHEAALAAYDAVLAREAGVPQVHHNRVQALQSLQRRDQALAAADALLTRWPDFVPALLSRCGLRLQAGDAAGASADAARAARIAPAEAEAPYAEGIALLAQRQAAAALAAFERCLALAPSHADALLNRGNTLHALRRHDEALASFAQAAAAAPQRAGIAFNEGKALLQLKRYDEAARAFERALALDPVWPYAEGQALHARLLACDWDGLDERVAAVRRGIAEGRRVAEPFGWCGLSDDPAELRRCAEIFSADQYAAPPAARAGAAAAGHGGADGRLRIGYLSGEFRNQATAILMTEWLELHDRSRFSVHAFDNGWDDGSTLRRRIEAAFDEMVDISALSDAAGAEAIAARGIDVLVNLNGFFGLGRNGVFARRPAPVQVNYLGFPGTVGAPWLDYLVAYAVVIPAGEDGAYAECVVRLPHCYQANDRRRPVAPHTPARAELGLPEGGFVFCCFNNTYKILPPVFAFWMRLLRAVPDAVLWLLQDNDAATARLRTAAAAAGVDPSRLVFAPRLRLDEHLARHRAADLFLDTLPYGAHTTASDALWAGLPLLSCRGRSFAGRVGASLLTALGLQDELLVEDLAAYEARALSLAGDRRRLRRVRERLAEARDRAPLFDAPARLREFERALQGMVERRRAGQPAAAVDVEADGA